MKIRNAKLADEAVIREIYLEAFPAEEREEVADLAIELLKEESDPSVLSLVAEEGGRVLGHVAFSPVFSKIKGNIVGYTMAPLAVETTKQRKGTGSRLVRKGMEEIVHCGVSALLVYGDPAYYSRFGFSPEVAERFLPPYKLQYPFGWLGIVLNEAEMPKSTIPISCVKPLRKPELW
ncbi:GNAT family N-acetyltransferase [Pelagicoccus mobilis]|uniref:N-acetyltransferase n=1 Tax=Pelagicoccus mobilis TaxID=415221 RepID=A0A934VR63_9BACT|nr:N-acetyltransferase [Pelagicoccus mobilis]MBK1879067.1 N-acetyltransferase [Pelagicoccus mobilis]